MKSVSLSVLILLGNLLIAQTILLNPNDFQPPLEGPVLNRSFPQTQPGQNRTGTPVSLILDYDLVDEIATIDSGGVQESFIWDLNSGFPDDSAHHFDLVWSAVTWDSLYDAVTLTGYSHQTSQITVDSFGIYFLHDHLTGTSDTDMIILNMWSYEGQFGLTVDGNNEITGAQLLHTDTFYATTSLAPFSTSNYGFLSSKPNLTLPKGARFTTEVRYYGDTINHFYVPASYKDICFQTCVAEPSVFKDNTFAKTIIWQQGQSFSDLTVSLFFDCDQSGSQTPGSCESFYIQNLLMQAFVTLTTSITARPHVASGSPCGGGPITLDANIAGGSGNYAVTWSGTIAVDSPNATITPVTIPPTGSYTFTVQVIDNIDGDTSTQDITINASAVPYVVDAGNNTNLGCTGGGNSAPLNASITTGNGAGSSYIWSNGFRGASIAGVPGTYTVTATDAGGCLSATDQVTIYGDIDLSFHVSHESCGSGNGSISAIVTGGIGQLYYAWSISNTTPTITGLSAGKYTLSVTDTSNCSIVDSVTVLDSCGIISGYVFNDINGNGIKDGSDQGVAGTEILALGGPAACANSMGYYEIIVPAYGIYTISVDTPYRYYCFNSLYLPDELTAPLNGSYSVTISAGNTIATGIDFGLEKPAITCGEVSGHVFEDANGNGIKEPGELGIAAKSIYINPMGFAYTNPAGNYNSDVPFDQQLTISAPNSQNYYCNTTLGSIQTFPLNPASYSVMVTQANPSSANNDFGFSQGGSSFEVAVANVWPPSSTDPCKPFTVFMDWKLYGQLSGDCYLKLEFDPDFAGFVNSNPPVDTVGPDFIGWYFPAGSRNDFGCYQMEFFMECKVYPGEIFDLIGRWDCDNKDGCPFNDSLVRTVTIDGVQKRTNSNSKNAMYVFHQNDEEKYAIEHADSSFSYVISFTNTTNDTAYNMTVVDTLPPHFQLNTISYPFSNKPFTFRVKQDNILVWQFDNVNLPPLRDNRLASSGFIQFNVVMKPNLPSGTLFENRAAITYNYGNTLITNTAENILGLVDAGPYPDQASFLAVYPNPNQGIFEIKGFAGAATSWQIELYDLNGRMIFQESVGEREIIHINYAVGQLSGGIYLLKVENGFHVATKKIVIQ